VGERALGSFLKQYRELVRREDLSPFFLRLRETINGFVF
jgi:hypothetical protein